MCIRDRLICSLVNEAAMFKALSVPKVSFIGKWQKHIYRFSILPNDQERNSKAICMNSPRRSYGACKLTKGKACKYYLETKMRHEPRVEQLEDLGVRVTYLCRWVDFGEHESLALSSFPSKQTQQHRHFIPTLFSVAEILCRYAKGATISWELV